MANLKGSEKANLEKYFEMKTGYVCDFSNQTFEARLYCNVHDFLTPSHCDSLYVRLHRYRESLSLFVKTKDAMLSVSYGEQWWPRGLNIMPTLAG